MNIRHEQKYRDPKEEPLALFVERALDGSDYESGALETARNTAYKAIEAISRLVEILAEKGILNGEDVARIAGVGGTVTLKP